MLNGPTELGKPGNLKPKALRFAETAVEIGQQVAQRLEAVSTRLQSRLFAQEKPEVVLQATVEGIDDCEVDELTGRSALRNRSEI